jgi:hypothetical protein
MPSLPTAFRRALRDKALAASRRLSTAATTSWPSCGPIQDFLKERDDFEADRSREKFLFTFNPRGWLRKLG